MGKPAKKKKGSNMANPAKTAIQIESHIARFSAKVSFGLDEPDLPPLILPLAKLESMEW